MSITASASTTHLAGPILTTPTIFWGYPYISNGIAPSPNASPILGGALQDNSLGIVGYAWVDQHIYVDLGGYVTQPPGLEKILGETYGPGTSTGIEPWASLTYAWFWGNSNAHLGGHVFYGRFNPATDVRSSDGRFGHNTYADFMVSNGYNISMTTRSTFLP